MAHPDEDWLAELARGMGAEPELDAVWERVVSASVTQVEGAEHGGITVASGTSLITPVASSDLVRQIDKQQYASGEGPCVSAAYQYEAIVRADDLATDGRWPEFAAAAVDLGVRSMLSFQLYTDTEGIGALNLYAHAPNAFTDESVHTGVLLAAHAAVAVAANTKTANLRVALSSRDVIGQAKGILMERYKITPQQSFDLLIAVSQQSHRKLKDIAADLADTGYLDGNAPRP